MTKIFIYFALLFSISTQSLAGEYEEWLKTQNQTLGQFRKSLDDDFTDMLKKDWESYKTSFTVNPFKEPKPKELPRIKKEILPPQEIVDKSPIIKIKKFQEQSVPDQTISEKQIDNKIEKETIDTKLKFVSINFYAQKLTFRVDKNFEFNLQTINNDELSKSWKSLSKLDIKPFIDDLLVSKNKLNLNDWAMYSLLNMISKELYKDENKSNIFNWFILTKMGFDTKIGYFKNNTYLMSTVKQLIYQMSFFTMSGKKYYVLNTDIKRKPITQIYTYDSIYPNANNKMSFDINSKAINISTNQEVKKLKFKVNNKEFKVEALYSKDLIDFYKTFPQAEYQLYFNAQESRLVSNSLLISLKPIVDGKSEIEATNILLRFVQTAFVYKTDEEQFGYEKVFFPEETLFYPYSDCEDRSIMFSYLVKNLVGLDVVGIRFEDHLATAVAFSSKIDGDNFVFNGKRYTIADPTYINANAGMTMPQYANKTFEVVK